MAVVELISTIVTTIAQREKRLARLMAVRNLAPVVGLRHERRSSVRQDNTTGRNDPILCRRFTPAQGLGSLQQCFQCSSFNDGAVPLL